MILKILILTILSIVFAATLQAAGPNTLTWDDNSTNEIGFEIQRQDGDGEWRTIALRISTPEEVLGVGERSWIDTKLWNGATFAYRVVAYNGETSSESSNITEVFLSYTPVVVEVVIPPVIAPIPASGMKVTTTTTTTTTTIIEEE